MIEFIGYLGAFMLAFCGAPQAWESYKNKHSNGISWNFLFMWGGGELLLLFYIFKTMGVTALSLPLLGNLVINILFVGVIAWYRLNDDEAHVILDRMLRDNTEQAD